MRASSVPKPSIKCECKDAIRVNLTILLWVRDMELTKTGSELIELIGCLHRFTDSIGKNICGPVSAKQSSDKQTECKETIGCETKHLFVILFFAARCVPTAGASALHRVPPGHSPPSLLLPHIVPDVPAPQGRSIGVDGDYV